MRASLGGARYGTFGPRLAARVLSALLQAGTLVVLARVTDIEDFGRYSAAVAMGAIVLGVAALGLPTRVLRLTDAESGRYRYTILVTATCLSVIAFCVVFAAAGSVLGGRLDSWLLAAAAFTATELHTNVLQNLLFGEQRERRIILVMVCRRLVPFCGTLVTLVAVPQVDVFDGLALSLVLSTVVCRLCAGPAGPRRFRPIELVRGSVHYWLGNIGAMLQQADVPIISLLIGPGPAGAYAGAFRLASPVHLVTSLLVSASVPAIVRSDGGEAKRSVARGSLRYGACYAVAVVLASPAMIVVGPAVLGDTFRPFGWAFAVLFATSGVSVLNQVCSAVLFGADRPAYVWRCGLVGTAVGLGCTVGGAAAGRLEVAFCGALVGQVALAALVVPKTWRVVQTGDFKA